MELRCFPLYYLHELDVGRFVGAPVLRAFNIEPELSKFHFVGLEVRNGAFHLSLGIAARVAREEVYIN
jgi:hypothetical protein